MLFHEELADACAVPDRDVLLIAAVRALASTDDAGVHHGVA